MEYSRSGQFVSKFTFDLSNRIYSTVFGSGNGINISPTAFLVDLCNKMYLAGWGGTVNQFPTYANNAGFTNNMPISSDAFQSTTDSSDFYIMVLEDDASGLVYGSYFGVLVLPCMLTEAHLDLIEKGKYIKQFVPVVAIIQICPYTPLMWFLQPTIALVILVYLKWNLIFLLYLQTLKHHQLGVNLKPISLIIPAYTTIVASLIGF